MPPPPFDTSSQRESGGAPVPHLEHDGKHMEPTVHIDLGFSLVQDGEARVPNEKEQDAILDLFPTCTHLTTRPPFIMVCCQSLSPKPWPATLAGLALYLTSEPNAEPLDIGWSGLGPGLTIDAEIHRTQLPRLETFIKIFSALDKYNTRVTKLQWISGMFFAMAKPQPKEGWRYRYPKSVNGVRIGYIFGEEAVHSPGRPTAKPFQNMVHISTLKMHKIITMNTPLNGHVEGTLLGVQVQRISTDEAARPWEHLEGALSYFGNGADAMLEGSRGAVVWTAEHDNGDGYRDWNVIGQFPCQVLGSDICYCPTYSRMASLGYSLSETYFLSIPQILTEQGLSLFLYVCIYGCRPK